MNAARRAKWIAAGTAVLVVGGLLYAGPRVEHHQLASLLLAGVLAPGLVADMTAGDWRQRQSRVRLAASMLATLLAMLLAQFDESRRELWMYLCAAGIALSVASLVGLYRQRASAAR